MDLIATPSALSQAKDPSPVTANLRERIEPFLASKTIPTGTRTSKPAKSSKRKAKAPKERRRSRPPKTPGYTWRKDGAGWELRKTVYVETGTGTTKRRRPYVAHLSKSAFAEMKRKHRGAALERAIAEWIAEHDKQ